MYEITTYNELTIITISLQDIEVSLLNKGATILDIKTRDKDNNLGSVVLKYKDVNSYINNDMYLNTTIGPLSGRTKDAEFTLNDMTYILEQNDNTNNLHSGETGLSFKTFTYQVVEETEETSVIFRYNSTDIDGIFPGNQIYKVIYKVRNTELQIEYYVETDRDTIINMTNHAYFNLSNKDTVLDHEMSLTSDYYLETDEYFVPIKKSKVPSNLNLNTINTVKHHINNNPNTLGLNHQFLITPSLSTPSATLYDKDTKRYLEVFTTYPVITCYTHNYPSDTLLTNNKKQTPHMGICFEAQYESNGINIEAFNSAILKKEDRYDETIIYKFSVKDND